MEIEMKNDRMSDYTKSIEWLEETHGGQWRKGLSRTCNQEETMITLG